MQITINEVEKYLGYKVKDPYGRIVGTITALFSDVDGKVTDIEVCVGNLTFKKYPAHWFTFKGDEVELLPEWKAKALDLAKQLEITKKRIKALEELYARGEITRDTYDEFRKKLEKALDKLREQCKEVKQELRNRIYELEDQILEIDRAITAVKMTFFTGEISEKSFKRSIDILRKGKERALEEKSDVKKVLEKLEQLESMPIEIGKKIPEEIKEESKETVPAGVAPADQPIVVHVIEG